MNMSEEKREKPKEKARKRYHGPAGERQRAVQYLKCLRCSLIQNFRPSTLERHGIEFADGEYHFKHVTL